MSSASESEIPGHFPRKVHGPQTFTSLIAKHMPETCPALDQNNTEDFFRETTPPTNQTIRHRSPSESPPAHPKLVDSESVGKSRSRCDSRRRCGWGAGEHAEAEKQPRNKQTEPDEKTDVHQCIRDIVYQAEVQCRVAEGGVGWANCLTL